MTLLWIALLPSVVTAAWFRYRKVLSDSTPRNAPEGVLRQAPPPAIWGNHEYQQGARWLHEIFERSAAHFPDLPALSVPERGVTLTYRELNLLANAIATSIREYVTGADQVVVARLAQDDATIVALHLGILKAGATQCFIDPESPEELFRQVLEDADPVLLITDDILTRCSAPVRTLKSLFDPVVPTTDMLPPALWLDEPTQRLASIFYTSGTTGRPKGVECPHAGYINLAQSYAQFYDFVPGSDATTLTSSFGYDGSISEMYSAWVAGCEVVLVTKAALRSGPDLLPLLREAQVTALFCPPVLLTTLTDRPEFDLPYPICRYIVPAGEAFPASLVEPWSRARRQVINTYGPTEVSTDTSRQLLRPNEAVTIGSPFPGVDYVILDTNTSTVLPHGEEGELCIGGVQLARRYRNLPEASRDRFVDHPRLGRLYRSGDRCHVDPETLRVHFHGRIDAQLKVRGYRIEAQPIESLLQDNFSEIETAVLDNQEDELIAFIRAPSLESPQDPLLTTAVVAHPVIAQAQALISERFPPYAIPSRFFLVKRFELVGTSGKINRRALPQVSTNTRGISARSAPKPAPINEDNPALDARVLEICRAELGADLSWDDDLTDWGAHSIAIARLTQHLQAAGYTVSVRDLLTDHRSARKIARLSPTVAYQTGPEQSSADNSHERINESPVSERQYPFKTFSLLQGSLAVLLRVPLLLIAAISLAIVDPEERLLTGEVAGFLVAAIAAYSIYLVLPFTNLGWVLLLRYLERILFGGAELNPGRYLKFSSQHLKLWWLEQQTDFVLKPLVNGLRSPVLFNWALRHLGANIHSQAFIAQSTEWYGPLTLITIARGAVVQAAVQISSVSWEGQSFVLDTINIGAGARVGSRAMVSGGASLGDNSWLTPLSELRTHCAPNSQIDGVPGQVVGGYVPPRMPRRDRSSAFLTVLFDARNVCIQFLLEIGLVVVPGAAVGLLTTWALGFDSLSKVNLDTQRVDASDLLVMSGSGVMGLWLGALAVSCGMCLFLRLTPTPCGWVSATSLQGILARYRQTKMNQIQQLWGWSLTGQYLRALAGVKFSKVGASECDALLNLLPEHLHADANVFIAQGCYCNVLDEFGTHLLVKPAQIPARFFASNNAMVESGPIPGNLLLGVSTPLGPQLYRPQYSDRPDPQRILVGNPPLEVASTDQQEPANNARPSLRIFFARFFLNDLASVGLIPGLTIFLATFFLVALNKAGFGNTEAALLTSLIVPLLLPLLALSIKLILVGNRWGRANSAPFWSIRHFTYFLAQDSFFRLMAGFMGAVSGTALANPILRRFGCSIGKRSLIGLPLQMSDWHAVDIGDDCVINGQMQLHSFENRVLTVRRTKIGNRSVINHGAMLMGGATLQSDVTVESQSLVLKAMQLSSGHHAGCPTQAVTDVMAAATPSGR